MYELKKDLKSKMFNKTDKKILKIAVLNFKDIGEDAAKSKAGEIVSSALSKHFINDKDFVFVERNRLDKILEELRLNMLGIIDEKDIKRVGLILGVDWLVIGEVSSVGNEFSVNARVANSETAEVIAASNINIDKEVLLKESSELYNLSKNYFNITGGAINFSDLNLKASSFGLEWRHNYSRKNYIKFSFKKSSNNSDLLDKKIISRWNIFNPADDLYVEETIKSAFDNPRQERGSPKDDLYVEETIKSASSFEFVYGFVRKFIFNTRFKGEIGANFNMLSSKQNIYYVSGGSSMGTFNIPVSNDANYYLPGLNFGIGIEKNIFKSHLLSFDFKYYKLKKLKRDVSAGNNSSVLQNYIDKNINSKEISSDYLYLGLSLGFPF